MKKHLICFIFCLSILSLCLTSVGAASQSYNWYCIRNKEHLQPKIDSNMTFINNYNSYYVDRNHSDNCNEKVIYLTFDAGYENGNIKKILDILKEENVPAAFFILENLILKNPELILQMVEDGHSVCNHTSKHRDITKYETKEELENDIKALEIKFTELTGQKMKKYFRPPEGKFDEKSLSFVSELGYKTIFWSFAYADWDNNNQMSEENAMNKILSNVHNGEIMLLHPTSSTNASVIKKMITELRSQGYRFASLDELVAV